MTPRYCPACDQQVMPVATDGGDWKCPAHGWQESDRSHAPDASTSNTTRWTPEAMQRRVTELRMLATLQHYR